MLKLSRSSPFSRTITVAGEGGVIAHIQPNYLREGSEFSIGGIPYRVGRPAFISGEYTLEQAGQVVCTATKPSITGRRFVVNTSIGELELRPESWFTTRIVVQKDGTTVGRIGPRPVITTKSALLPPTLRVDEKLFLIALAVIIWIRQS